MSILIDVTLKFGYTNGKEIENEAKKFWKTIATGNSIRTANAFINLLDFLISNKVALFGEDVKFMREELYEHYLKIKFEKIPVPEKVDLSHDSHYENIHDHTDLLPKIEERLNAISIKKPIDKQVKQEDFEEITEDTLTKLREKVQEFVKSEENLAMLEYHIGEVYAQSHVSMNDYFTLSEIVNRIEQMLNRDADIVKKYGKAKVENFGSSANTLWSMDSDIDIVVEFEKESKGKSRDKEKGKDNDNDNRRGRGRGKQGFEY